MTAFSGSWSVGGWQPQSSIHGRDPEEIYSATTKDDEDLLRGPERMLDFLVRTGPYGDGYGAYRGG